MTTGTLIDTLGHDRISRWRAGWDAMMAAFVPAMASCEEAVFSATEGVRGGPPSRVLDLGGGPGVLVERMGRRWPGAALALIDIDPVLLSLARAAVPHTVTVREADLSTPAWTARTGSGFDLVTVVMTMHYLDAERARALYREARGVIAPGGLLIVADLMPEESIPTVMQALNPGAGEAVAELAWAQWWAGIAEIPELERAVRARTTMVEKRPPAEFTAGPSWHLAAARSAGFAEAGILWRCGRHAALVAVAQQ